VIVAAGVTLSLVAFSALLHYEALRLCNDRLPRLDRVASRASVLLAIAAAFASHLVQIAAFAAAYGLLHGTAVGSLQGHVPQSAASFLYFSVETYTSLGFGDVYPAGPMRLMAGMEALTGLLMIGWTTSYTYLEMMRHWTARER
jgi:hypothetical protein